MQVIADSIKDATKVLGEVLDALHQTQTLCEATMPIAEWMKTATTRKSPPVYVAETGKVLKENFIEDFGAAFPTVSTGIMNGRLGDASYRMHDGIYKLGTCLIKIKERKFMLMQDAERVELHNAMLDVVADFAIYTVIAFQLHQVVGDICTLAVSQVCERQHITPSILYGEMMEIIKSTGRTYYAYEPLSPLYGDMMAAEPTFLAECEENELPLTEDLAQALLDGEYTTAMLQEYLLKQVADVESKEVDVNPISMIQRMNLE